jgi:hypothetical protein
MRLFSLWRCGFGALVGSGAVVAFGAAAAASVPAYVSVGSFSLPSGSSAFDVLGDGRVVAVDENGVVLRQGAVNNSAFAPIGSLPAGTVPSFGAGFVRVSPDGSRLAVGDNGAANRVYVVQTASLSTGGPSPVQTISVPSFDGAWTSPTTMYVNGSPSFGTSPSLWRVDITSGTATAVVGGIGDGSGGVAASGGANARVYTAIGFDLTGLRTGEVRSFDLATLNAASAAAPFGAGALAVQANTASSLALDGLGDLIVAGGGGVSVFDLSTSQRYDLPGLSASGFYSATFDNATGEILVRDFGATAVLRYGVPAPGWMGVAVGVGFVTVRRRRR